MVKALAPPSKSISGENQALSGGKSSTCQNSTGFKWAGERLKNGGAGSGGVVVKANGKIITVLLRWDLFY